MRLPLEQGLKDFSQDLVNKLHKAPRTVVYFEGEFVHTTNKSLHMKRMINNGAELVGMYSKGVTARDVREDMIAQILEVFR